MRFLLLACCMSLPVAAQTLPPPSRTVFKCEAGGKVSYSDAPCLGGQKLELEPTRGVSKLSGKEKVGSDVRRELHSEMLANAVRPLTGMDPKQFEVAKRRVNLSAKAQQSCRRLDQKIQDLESDEQRAVSKSAIQEELYTARLEFRNLRC